MDFMDDEAVESAICRICETSVPAKLLTEHSAKCSVKTSCFSKIEACNDKFATYITTIERRLNRLVALQTKLDEVALLQRYERNARRMIELDKEGDVAALTHDIMSELDSLDAHDAFFQALRGAISQTLLEKSDALLALKDVLKGDTIQQNSEISGSAVETHIPTVDDFVICKALSHGSFGEVYLAKKKSTKEYYALKVLKKRDLIRKNQLSHALNERRMMALINSPHVVKLYYSFQTVDSLYMVLEYANGGDVFMLLRSVGTFTESWARFYIAEVVLALEHIHSLGIVHRDIKPDNLLITSTGHIKLADFGLSKDGMQPTRIVPDFEPEEKGAPVQGSSQESRLMQRRIALTELRARSKQTLFSYVGTPDYLAPEVITGQGHDTTLDWWTVGACLYEFLIGIPPFFEETIDATYKNILARHIEWPSNISPEARDIIDKLLQVDPTKRLGARGAQEVKSHPFFAGLDWANVAQASPAFVPATSQLGGFDCAHNLSGMDDLVGGVEHMALRTSGTPLTAPAQNEEELDEHSESVLADPENFMGFQFKNVSLLNDENQRLAHASPSTLPTASITLESETTDGLMLERRTHCLVAEDNPVTQVLVKALMKQMGINITQAYTGAEAVNKANHHKFDIIFMDIMMPEMDGTEATRIVRTAETSLNRDTPIIAFTALCDWNTSAFARDGMNDLLAKPFTKAELYNILKKWLPDAKHQKVSK